MTGAEHKETPEEREHHGSRVSRRGFLAGSSAALAATGLTTIAVATTHGVEAAPPLQATPPAGAATPVGGTPVAAAPPGPPQLAYFNIQESATVEAITARIFPGSPDDPGAREAMVTRYIDRSLSGGNLGFSLKTYQQGPFLEVSEQETPVESSSATDLYHVVLVSPDIASRYGFQSPMTPQEMYRIGLAALDAYAQSKFQANFVDLNEDDQDTIVGEMADGKAEGFNGIDGRAFFTKLRNDTIEGMFSDPMYGGNQDLVGWKLIGYPGAQRFYTAADLQKPGTDRQPQSLAQLAAAEGH